MRAGSKEYLFNSFITISLTLSIWLLWIFIDRFFEAELILLLFPVLAMPHFIMAALGYFSTRPKQVAAPYLLAAIVSVPIGLFVGANIVAPLVVGLFYGYFLLHHLDNELMFEDSVSSGYRKMTSSWPTSISLIMILPVIVIFLLLSFPLTGTAPIFTPPISLFVVLILLIAFWWLVLAKGNGVINNLPGGYITLYVFGFIALLLIVGRVSVFATHLLRLIAVAHVISWNVFYTRKLIARGDLNMNFNFWQKLLFGWRRSWRAFLGYWAVLQIIFIFLAAVFLIQEGKGPINYMLGASWWPFWTVFHVTTSFTPKPDSLIWNKISFTRFVPSFPRLASQT